ncbi:hypothetical protein F4824DRAFT_258553 [Ustulina deusta]|nr:hypothetical protein F4823DRAFT_595851 [Ustulina deusta]KAI3333110.1 hypothetical protein F4824DRAFT_258553 [Ustulina deusta]
MTDRGLLIEVHLTALNDAKYVTVVDCPPPHTNKTVPLSSRIYIKSLVTPREPTTFPLLRGVDWLSAGNIVERGNGEHIVVLIGSLQSFPVSFDAWGLGVDTDPREARSGQCNSCANHRYQAESN